MIVNKNIIMKLLVLVLSVISFTYSAYSKEISLVKKSLGINNKFIIEPKIKNLLSINKRIRNIVIKN